MPSAVVGGIAFVAKLAAAKGAAAILSAAAFKTFATGAIFGLATSTLMKEFAKKPSKPSIADASSGVAGSTRGLTGSVIPRRWIVGRARVSGGLIWLEDDDNYSWEVRVLSEGSIDGIERVWAHGDEVPMVRNGNVLTPAPDSRYWGDKEETYTEVYYETPTTPGDGDGPADRPGGPGRAGACGGCRSCNACNGGGADGTAPGTANNFAHDGQWIGSVNQYDGRSLDMSPWALARYDEAVMGTHASAGAMASASGAQGEQGEGGGRIDLGASGAQPARQSSVTRVRRTRTRTRTVRVPLIKITEFFKADGSEGDEIRAIATGDKEINLPWTDEHRCNGFSYVLIEYYQPDYGTEIDDRFWPGRPLMHFLVRGLKISYPVVDTNAPTGRRLTEPTWTRNAAAIRYWYLTERRQIDPLLIDLDHFESARQLCDTELELSAESGYQTDYPEVVKRYTIDGVITSGDSASAVDAQMDFAWQGFVVEHSGMLVFRPGADLPPRFTITEDDIIGDPSINPFGRRSDLSNELSLTIEQSSGSEYLTEDFTVVDTTAQASDGERLPQELSQMKFVTEPVQAVNLLHQRLRQQRSLVTAELHVKSPPDWRYLELIAGDKIELQLPEHGIGVDGANLRYFRVTGVQINDDFSVNINLLEWPDNLFADRFDFPPRQQKFSYEPRALPAPVATGNIDWNINREGAVVWTAFLSWNSNPYETYISVDSDVTSIQAKRTLDKFVSFDLTEAGRYTFNLHHIARDGLRSPQSQVVLDATYVDIPLPRPVILDVTQNSNIIVIRVENVPNRDITGLDVRYNSSGLNASFADIPVITEADWSEAPQMNVSPVVPPNENDPIFAYAVVPASGTYRIYVRLRNRVGNLSPISVVHDARFEIPASATGTYASQPQWAGPFKNALEWTHDGEHRVYTNPANALSAIPYSAWEGASDFPFGEHTGHGLTRTATGDKTTYTTLVRNFELAKRREVYVAIETDSPDGKRPTSPDGYEITLLHSAEEDLANPTAMVVSDGASTNLPNVRSVQAVVNFYNQRNHVLTAVTIGWREIE